MLILQSPSLASLLVWAPTCMAPQQPRLVCCGGGLRQLGGSIPTKRVICLQGLGNGTVHSVIMLSAPVAEALPVVSVGHGSAQENAKADAGSGAFLSWVRRSGSRQSEQS